MSFPFPKYIQLYPTARCNQDCSFCFNSKTSVNNDLSYTNALKLLGILNDNGIKEIDIMGGEPLLLLWMPDFVDAAINKNISINISSNGSIPGMFKFFRGINPLKFKIGISLEGSTEEKHNTLTNSNHFKNILTSIENLAALGFYPLIKTVINRNTMEDVQNIIDLISGIGIKRYYMIHMDLLSKNEFIKNIALNYFEFINLYETIKAENPAIEVYPIYASCFNRDLLPPDVRCAGGVLKISVMPDGTAYPCNLFHSMEEFMLGNVFENDFMEIWGNPRLDFFRQFSVNNCRIEACFNRALCTGGCPAHGFYHYKALGFPDIRCCL